MTAGKAQRRPVQQRRLRCSIYTRKSSEEGLEQSFNSLHAQRDACEAYVASQKHEGWVLLPTAYDDGGLSGGSMERPALQRLLDDVRAGLVDVAVVYKVDRLTRSLADFARLTELFEEHGTSFVSVTQQFNTSTSMGRLTLNVLLSFAQFEREVAGERIRDKIALSKRRGMWMGGLPPLGYDGVDRSLVINGSEAKTVRLIYRRYLEVGSIAALKRSLDADGIVSKRRQFEDGRCVGGLPISRGALYQILRNRLYRGEIAHRGEIHQGNHEVIVDPDLWDEVQRDLEGRSARVRGKRSGRSGEVHLTGLLFDGAGNRMTPSYAKKPGRRYRYYVSAPLVLGSGDGMRVPAPDVERLVVRSICEHLRDPIWLSRIAGTIDLTMLTGLSSASVRLADRIEAETDDSAAGAALVTLRHIADRIVVESGSVRIILDPAALQEVLTGIDERLSTPLFTSDELIEIAVAASALRCGRQVKLVLGEVETDVRAPDDDLLNLLRDGRRWFEDLRADRAGTIAEIARRDRQQVSHVSRTISLAFLAPDIVGMIVAGKQPHTLTPEALRAVRPLPLDWDEQRRVLLG